MTSLEAAESYLDSNLKALLETMPAPRKALFLDRDGVINVDHGYVCSPMRTDFVAGVFDLVATANANNFLVLVVTNQAGIARGYYSEADFHSYSQWMCREFYDRRAHLDAIYYCPHHPTMGVGKYMRACDCRKPRPGMLTTAQYELQLDLKSSLLIGDKVSDIEAGLAAGVGKNLLLGSSLLPSLDAAAFYLASSTD